jgi:hypothetical protein
MCPLRGGNAISQRWHKIAWSDNIYGHWPRASQFETWMKKTRHFIQILNWVTPYVIVLLSKVTPIFSSSFAS